MELEKVYFVVLWCDSKDYIFDLQKTMAALVLHFSEIKFFEDPPQGMSQSRVLLNLIMKVA